MYTLMASYVLAGVEPWAYLADVLETHARGWPQRRLEELLPPMWKVAHEAAARPPSTAPAATCALPLPVRLGGAARYHILAFLLHRSAERIR
ncbi:transposase domain-containing protein [Archangium violaceum]|nr:transposase domain-containing protein [Archangium violaceum]